MAKGELATASVLAFERKLDTSDGVFTAGRWEDRDNADRWPGVKLREKSVRGTISNRVKGSATDPAKLDAQIQSPNLQNVDVATLPLDADTLQLRFTLRVLGGVGVPSACNNAAYGKKLAATVNGYIDGVGFSEIARRYAHNLASGRCLWRNRIGAENVEVRIAHCIEGQEARTWVFDGLDLPLNDFSATGDVAEHLKEVAKVIRDGLVGDSHVLLDISTFARMGAGQEVFPSQELILDKGGKGQKSKTLYAVGETAGMHSQKIGNALRTIDTWYPEADEFGPIAVEVYGAVTSQGRAFRQPKQKADFYTLLDGWVLKDKVPEPDQQHFVMATLIRGGVFGAKAD
jgi:CRISPR-associated protein Csy3